MSAYPLLTACELATLRDAAAAALDTPVSVTHTSSTTAGTYGQQVPTTSVLATCNARFTQPSAPVLANYGEKIAHLQTWLVALPSTVLPSDGDTITTTADGTVYTVHAVLQPQSFSTLNRVLVARAN